MLLGFWFIESITIKSSNWYNSIKYSKERRVKIVLSVELKSEIKILFCMESITLKWLFIRRMTTKVILNYRKLKALNLSRVFSFSNKIL
jgi:hypothetical protein